MIPSMPRLITPERSAKSSPNVAEDERRGDADQGGEKADLKELGKQVMHVPASRDAACIA